MNKIFLLVLFYLFCASFGKVQKIFNIRPGVDESVEVSEGGITCKFWYSVSGGSSEEWQMSLEREGNQYTCFISRGRMSSLYFKDFKASFDGRPLTDSVLMDNSDRELHFPVKNNVLIPKENWKGGANAFAIVTSVSETTRKDEL
eukprot:TRINITY_DN1863_c0_g1_i2.p1 TRINITY_DN1863_c0_g1~~TRINITY_DN1863_c0_g1_i2.p1  ORF type:complete len:145 (-),score=21.50 TRINITY_DN1863_c0_g1_i2:52-486(-)